LRRRRRRRAVETRDAQPESQPHGSLLQLRVPQRDQQEGSVRGGEGWTYDLLSHGQADPGLRTRLLQRRDDDVVMT